MEKDDDFYTLMQNTLLYGTGVLIMQHRENGEMGVRVVPIEEYTQTGEHLQWVDQNTKETR
jgi:putative AlgH/UPF0301 family transcriptional regulator